MVNYIFDCTLNKLNGTIIFPYFQPYTMSTILHRSRHMFVSTSHPTSTILQFSGYFLFFLSIFIVPQYFHNVLIKIDKMSIKT